MESGKHSLRTSVLVSIRREHQTAFAVKAVRKVLANNGNGNTSFGSSKADDSEEPRHPKAEPTLRQKLSRRMKQLLANSQLDAKDSDVSGGSTSGVARQVRHTGKFQASTSNAREQNKKIVQSVTASVRSIELYPVF